MRRPPHRRSARLALALALTALAASRPAVAAPYVRPTLALGLEESYDSNVLNGRGADYVTRITPHLALHVVDPRVDLRLSYDIGVWLYALGRADDTVNHQGRAELAVRATRRLILKVADEIVYAHDPAFLLRTGVVAPQTSIFNNILDAELDYLITRRLEGALAYSFRRTTFGTPPPGADRLFDGDEHDVIGALTFQLGRLDELRVTDRFAWYTADGLDLALTDSPSAGWRHRFVSWVDLRVEAGPLYYGVLDEGRSLSAVNAARSSGWTWRGAALIRIIRPTLRATVGFNRDLFGGTGAASVLWANYFTANVAWRIANIFELGAGTSVFANGFAPSERRLYDGVGADATASVQLARGLRLGAFYSFRWQEAPGAAGGAALPAMTRHIAGVRLVGAWGEEAGPPRHPHP